MIQRISLFFLAIGGWLLAVGQQSEPAAPQERSVSMGLVLSTRGTGLCARMGFPAGGQHLAASISITGLHSPYERRIESPYGGRRYALGKLNTAQMAAAGLAWERTVVALRGGNLGELRVGGFANANLAISRPYYVDVLRDPNNNGQLEPVSEAYNPEDPAHNYQGIYGRSQLPTNVQYTVNPGLGVGIYTLLDLSHDSYQVSGLLFALQADVMAKELQLVSTRPANRIFVAASCSLLLGSKW